MDEENRHSLYDRVVRLEKTVEELKELLKRQQIEPSQAETAPVSEDTEERKQEVETEAEKEPQWVRSVKEQQPTERKQPEPVVIEKPAFFSGEAAWMKSEFWLNKIGIGLSLFGLVFLFKYSIDKGWLTPEIRVVAGLAAGIALLITGFRISGKRPHFGQVLLGGGIGALYITGFAAYQLYSMVGHTAAFSFMVAVTVIAFVLSLRQNAAVLTLIGALGGLGTPFLLYTQEGSIPGLITYTCLVLAGTGAIYLFRGWCSVHWVSVIGGWIVFGICCDKGIVHSATQPGIEDRWAVQAGMLVFGWLVFWLLPVAREVFHDRLLSFTKKTDRRNVLFPIIDDAREIFAPLTVHLMAVTMPLVTLGYSRQVWELSDTGWGWLTLGAAAVYGLVFLGLSKKGLSGIAWTHGLTGLGLLTLALWFLFSGNQLFVVLTIEAACLHTIGIRLDDKGLRVFSHALTAVMAVWLAVRLVELDPGEQTFLTAPALAEMALIIMMLAVSVFIKSYEEKEIYKLLGIVFLTMEVFLRLKGNVQFAALGAGASLVHLAHYRMKDLSLSIYGHVLFGIAAIMFLGRLFSGQEGSVVFNAQAMADMAVIGAMFGLSFLFAPKIAVRFYRLAAHLFILGWLARELVPLSNGQAYVTASWSLYAVVLLVASLKLNIGLLRTVAMSTVILVVGKLFLVDLARLEAIWRILLFMSFGTTLLVLSYYFRSLWKVK